MLRIAVLMACYNRRDQTVRCLAALNQQVESGGRVIVYLVDDGCSDGTAEAAATFENVRILRGDGSLYWTRGMHLAFATAMAEGYDGYLWLNDDVVLDADALSRLVESCTRLRRRAPDQPVIVVGSTRDPDTGQLTYGGIRRRSRLRPLKYIRVEPGPSETEIDTMEGNFVFVPERTARLVGNLDPVFLCAAGDTDYGLRAGRAGVRLWLMPGTVGCCRSNPPSESWRAPGVGVRERWRRKDHPARGLPWIYWSRYAQRHGGPLWLLHALWAYRRIVWPTERPVVVSRGFDANGAGIRRS